MLRESRWVRSSVRVVVVHQNNATFNVFPQRCVARIPRGVDSKNIPVLGNLIDHWKTGVGCSENEAKT